VLKSDGVAGGNPRSSHLLLREDRPAILVAFSYNSMTRCKTLVRHTLLPRPLAVGCKLA
jgi:hypothetical protein